MKAEITNQSSPSSGYQNDLIEACKRGDHKAQLQVYKLYYRSIYNICLRIVNDPITAEDIMHESFLSAFENISSYCGDTSFSSWLNSFIKYNV
jgi:DNA-directed RNA polymerase specialized sigma24 family protein